MAELTYGTLFARKHDLDVDGAGSADLDVLGAGIEFTLDQFLIGAEAAEYDIEGFDLTLQSVGAEYRLQNGLSLGLEYVNLDVDGLADSSITSLYGYYSFQQFALGASVGDGSDLSDNVYSVFAAYDVSDTGRVGLDILSLEDETLYAAYADYDQAKYEIGSDLISTDGLDILALSGAYKITDNIALTGSISQFDVLGIDTTGMSFGAAYQFNSGIEVEASIARLDVEGVSEDLDVFTLGIGIETGRRTSVRRSVTNIVNSATGSIINLSGF